MNNNDYHTLPAVSSHWLIEMLNSPAACWRKYLDPQRPAEEPTGAMRFGTLVHALALTPKQLEREFRVIHEDRRSRIGRAGPRPNSRVTSRHLKGESEEFGKNSTPRIWNPFQSKAFRCCLLPMSSWSIP